MMPYVYPTQLRAEMLEVTENPPTNLLDLSREMQADLGGYVPGLIFLRHKADLMAVAFEAGRRCGLRQAIGCCEPNDKTTADLDALDHMQNFCSASNNKTLAGSLRLNGEGI